MDTNFGGLVIPAFLVGRALFSMLDVEHQPEGSPKRAGRMGGCIGAGLGVLGAGLSSFDKGWGEYIPAAILMAVIGFLIGLAIGFVWKKLDL